MRENALLRRLLQTSYEIQESVLGHAAAPRELVEQAEKAMLEVARDDRQKDFRTIEEVLHEELDKLHRLSPEGTSLTGTPSGFKDLDEITGGFQPGQPDHHRRPPRDGQERARLQHRRERRRPARQGRSRCSRWRWPRPSSPSGSSPPRRAIKGEELRKGRVPEQRWPKILEASQRLAAAPLWVDDSSDVGMLEIRAKARRLHSQSRAASA